MTSPLDPATIEECARVADTKLAKKLCEIVDGWGEPRHDKRLGFTAMKAGITCGDVYEFVDAIRALPSSPPGWRDIASAPRDGQPLPEAPK